MFLQKRGQVSTVQVFVSPEGQFHQVTIGFRSIQLTVVSQIGDSAQRHGVLGALERKDDRVRTLGEEAGPGLAFIAAVEADDLLVVPEELADAARIDGCSEYRIWWSIFMPLAKPALTTVAIFTFLRCQVPVIGDPVAPMP